MKHVRKQELLVAREQPDLPDLSPSQREIMEIVWERGEVTANEVRRVLSRTRNVARNTVRTLLERMEAKGWLKHRAEGRTFLYTAARPRHDTIGQKVREIVETICGGSPETLVTALLDYRGLRPDELKRIRQLLDDAQAGKGQKGGS
jgi:predicted transcriptional regulator